MNAEYQRNLAAGRRAFLGMVAAFLAACLGPIAYAQTGFAPFWVTVIGFVAPVCIANSYGAQLGAYLRTQDRARQVTGLLVALPCAACLGFLAWFAFGVLSKIQTTDTQDVGYRLGMLVLFGWFGALPLARLAAVSLGVSTGHTSLDEFISQVRSLDRR